MLYTLYGIVAFVICVYTVGVSCVVGENVGVAYSDTEICSSQFHHRVAE